MTASPITAHTLEGKDLLTGAEWTPEHLRDLLQLTAEIKAHPERFADWLRAKCIALIFEKPSLRTRVTFEVGIKSMGGSTIFLDHTQAGRLGERESIPDVARNLDGWVQGIVARVYDQNVLAELAANARIPVINALSDRFHPCQALADYFTIEEKFGSAAGFVLSYVGDGNNVCSSLLHLGARLGAHLRIATPPGYTPAKDVLTDARKMAQKTAAKIELFTDPVEAVAGAQAVYTDAWTSMGFESESTVRESIFQPYQVNRALLAKAARGAVFMHCLPAHRGQEVTADVLDGPQSVALDQSENRMYAQKAILYRLYR
jgi:ornithine carbamoyltransferase